jgi:NitT/TauT family transport system substrate-binding protein
VRMRFIAIIALIALAAGSAQAADHVKIGVVKVAANGPNFIAMDKGYFAAEGIDAEILPFDSAEPIAVAIVSGDIDFGATGPGAAFYNLAGQNKIRIVSGLPATCRAFRSSPSSSPTRPMPPASRATPHWAGIRSRRRNSTRPRITRSI